MMSTFLVVTWFIFELINSSQYINKKSLPCQSKFGFEGNIKVLNDTSEIFWHLEHKWIYIEFYFLSFYWINIGLSRMNN